MTEAATHLRELAERIGPRPATTDTEAEAADYIQGRFESRGIDVQRQDFVAPRTYAWAYVAYHTLTIGAAVLAGFFAWPAFVIALLVAIVMTLDLDTRWGLSNLMPKGPSQNIIGRKGGDSRRGEVTRKVVVVAHYDSARSSLAFSPGMVKNFNATFGVMKWCTWLVSILALVVAFDFAFLQDVREYTWYVTMAASAYLIVPLLINVHRELAMDFVDGANDNASGVAAMLGVLERACPEEVVHSDTRAMRAAVEADTGDWAPSDLVAGIAANADAWVGAGGAADTLTQDTQPHDVVPPQQELPRGSVMNYSPAGPLDDSFADAFGEPDESGWEEPAHVEGQHAMDVGEDLGEPPTRVAPGTGTRLGRGAPTEPASVAQGSPLEASEALDPDTVEADESDGGRSGTQRKAGWFKRRKRDEDGKDWLGVGGEFDVMEEGRRIGSWDQFDGDESGSKGGTASWSEIEAPDFASSEAARIRHKITHGVDRGLAEKEIWFVATGSEETGTWGMRNFLAEYADELKGATIINIDNVGTGSLAWVTREGMAVRYTSDRRLMSAARRVAREREMRVKGVPYNGLSTDATPALARGMRAMSVMAFDINGRLPNWHWKTDTVDNVSVSNIDQAAEFVAAIIEEL